MFHNVHRYLLASTALIVFPLGASAAEVSLSGQASVKYTPDSARLQFTARAEHKLPETATEEVNEQMEKWRESIEDFRGQLKSYSDASLNLYSRSIPSPERHEEPRRVAVASQTVSFTIDDLSLLNPILAQAQSLGMDYNVGPHQFFHSDEGGLLQLKGRAYPSLQFAGTDLGDSVRGASHFRHHWHRGLVAAIDVNGHHLAALFVQFSGNKIAA